MPRRVDQNSGSDRTRRGSSVDSKRSRRRASDGESDIISKKSSHKKAADLYKAKSISKEESRTPGHKSTRLSRKNKAAADIDAAANTTFGNAQETTAAPDKKYEKKDAKSGYTPGRTHKKASHAKKSAKPVRPAKPEKPAKVSKKEKAPAVKKEKTPRQNKVSPEIRNNFIKLGVMVAVGVGVIIGIYYGIQAILERQIGFEPAQKEVYVEPVSTQVPRERNVREAITEGEQVTADPAIIRDISYGARDIGFKEKQINMPGIYDNELLFSAGTGSLYVGSDVLNKLYLYNLDAGDETLITESDIDFGEFYETLVNHQWLVWLETDHGTKNYIMVMNRSTGKVSKLQSFKEGQPKLSLYGNLLVWMQQVSDTEDRLLMMDLEVQEPFPIHAFTDKATYGVSAPYVYEDTIVWADHDPTQSEEDKANGEKSAIYYLQLKTDESGYFEDPKYYAPGTYVHEPLYNGDVFVWLDANKSPKSNLYIGRVGEEPIKIGEDITTYSIGDGIVVYGKNQAVWVYVIATGELCRLTSEGEMGMLPSVTKRTVVWYNLTADSEKDVLRFKILTDEELYPGGLD